MRDKNISEQQKVSTGSMSTFAYFTTQMAARHRHCFKTFVLISTREYLSSMLLRLRHEAMDFCVASARHALKVH